MACANSTGCHIPHRVRFEKGHRGWISPTNGDLRIYARGGGGGARPVRATAGAEKNAGVEVATKCQASSAGIKEFEFDSRDGWLCHFPGEAFSALFWPTLRFVEGDSSISARMARRSSVAEMTGKRTTSTQPRESRHCRAVSLRPAEPFEPRHSQKAGKAKNSQARLSSSSIKKFGRKCARTTCRDSFSEIRNLSQCDPSLSRAEEEENLSYGARRKRQNIPILDWATGRRLAGGAGVGYMASKRSFR